MANDILANFPARRGHFLLESGYHSDTWLTLDELFVDSAAVAPWVASLAEELGRYAPRGVCGPLLGGAFLAQAVAAALGARFYFTEPVTPPRGDDALFTAEYRLPPGLRRLVRGEPVAIVDDVISAGSSVRATAAALSDAGASVVAVGALLVLGETASSHFAARSVPLLSLQRSRFDLWTPGDCPACRSGVALEDPRS
jgi:orotate phosphoribosyltransferase